MKKIVLISLILSLVALNIFAGATDIPKFNTDKKFKIKPDLWIYDFLSDQQNPVKVGDSITFDCIAILDRIGEEGWSAQIKMNGKVIKDTEGVNVSMAGHGVWTEYVVPKAGHYVAECILDSKNDVVESDETNNRKRITFKAVEFIQPSQFDRPARTAEKPTIKVVDIVMDEVSVKTRNDVPVLAGTETKIDCIWHRMGVEPSPFRIAVLVDGKPLGLKDGSVVDHTSRGTTLSTPWKAEAGIHTIKCIADTQNRVIESNEKNNSKGIKITVLPLSNRKVMIK